MSIAVQAVNAVAAVAAGPKEFRNRKVLSRANAGAIAITEVDPAEYKACPPPCGLVPPCTKDEVKAAWKESAYIYIAENRIEWNQPFIVAECRGICPSCRVDDNVTVIYWDQPYVKNIRNIDNCMVRCQVRCFTCVDGDIITMHDNHCLRACWAKKGLQDTWYMFVKKGTGEIVAADMTKAREACLAKMG